MIRNFHKVTDNLYRGGNLHPKDVLELKEKYGINKIVSLDKKVAARIDRSTKLLNIEHIIIPLDGSRKSLLNLLSYNLKKLLGTGKVFVGCVWGKDRTGFVVALYKCRYLGEKPEKAIQEAKKIGFGIGCDPKMIALYEKIIQSCKPEVDNNDADIVSNQREYIGDNRDSFLDEGRQGSFAPYLDPSRTYPMDNLYNPTADQFQTRENYDPNKEVITEIDKIPQNGVFNNDAGLGGAGPTVNMTGFIYD